MSERTLPVVGYSLSRVVAVKQNHSVVPPHEAKSEDEQMSFGWDWRPAGKRTFFVYLGLLVHPSTQRLESTEISLIGEFHVGDGSPDIPFDVFVTQVAPHILFPYLREMVSNLTGRGPFGPFIVPPMNASSLISSDFTFTNSSGIELLRTDKKLAKLFDFPEAVVNSDSIDTHMEPKKRSRTKVSQTNKS